MPTLIDLFAGCGGMTRGFTDLGFAPVLAVEHNLHAAATYAANYGEDHVFWGAIEDVPDTRVTALGEIDAVIGGPPCQGFSQLGLEDPNDPRNQLWREYLRIVLLARPKVFVIENVDRFAKSPEFGLLMDEVDKGKLSDYEVSFEVLNAADYGVAQRRRRTIIVGSRVGSPRLPKATHAQDPTPSLPGLGPEPWVPLRSVLRPEPREPHTTELPERRIVFFDESVPGVFASDEIHVGRNPTELSLRRYDSIPPGGSRFDLPLELLAPCWERHTSGSADVMGRLEWDKPSVTIRTEFYKPEKGRYLHPQWDDRRKVNRPLTHLEAAKIQGFPPEYLWCGSKTEIARQIGNAVPPPLARAIAAEVTELIGE